MSIINAGDTPIAETQVDGTELARRLERLYAAFHSQNSNATRPPFVTAGGIWSKTVTGGFDLMMYDGTVDVKIGSVINGVINLPVDTAGFVQKIGDTMTGPLTVPVVKGATTLKIQTNSVDAISIDASQNVSTSKDILVNGVTVGKGDGTNCTAVGNNALAVNTGQENTAIGHDAGLKNTTGNQNTYIGYASGYNNTTGSGNTAVGFGAGATTTTNGNSCSFGYLAGNLATGAGNQCFGYGAGSGITTGANNTIVGAFNGNQNGLDIRTASNNIVLSDGDGNPRVNVDSAGTVFIGPKPAVTSDQTLSVVGRATVAGVGTIYMGNLNSPTLGWTTGPDGNGNYILFAQSNIGVYLPNGGSSWIPQTSDSRLKDKKSDIENGLDAINHLKPLTFNYKNDEPTQKQRYGYFAQEVGEVIPDAMIESPMQDKDLGNVYTYDPNIINVYMVKAIQELSAQVTELQAQVKSLTPKA